MMDFYFPSNDNDIFFHKLDTSYNIFYSRSFQDVKSGISTQGDRLILILSLGQSSIIAQHLHINPKLAGLD